MVPPHVVEEDGHLHARGNETPFLCGDASTGARVACPTQPPALENLSCDASGCHGSYDYDPATPQDDRSLDGDDAPSCYDCHGKEWNDRKE